MTQDRSDRAEHWHQRVNAADCTADERAEFERWQAEKPEHAAAYERVDYLYRRAADLRSDPHWRALGQSARQTAARAARLRRGIRLTVAAAALVIVVAAIGWQLGNPVQPEQHYATAIGERRTITLNDGSTVVLDTDSELTVIYSRKQRDLVLLRGRAQFSVASQPQRPFVVESGGGAVRAVGTQFQVRKRDADVLVTLLEGVVTVSTVAASPDAAERIATLAAGEQLSFDDRQLGVKQAVDLAVAQGWTRGELVFDRRPLQELIDEMNRYTTVKLRLEDPSLKDLPVSGAFYDNDQDSLVRALEIGWPLRAERISSTEILLHPRR